MQPRIVKGKIALDELARIARENFDTMVKVAVDVKLLLAGDETLPN